MSGRSTRFQCGPLEPRGFLLLLGLRVGELGGQRLAELAGQVDDGELALPLVLRESATWIAT